MLCQKRFFVFASHAILLWSDVAAHAPSPQPPVQLGTTIIAARYNKGVVIAADTRTSVSGYVSNRFASKISFILDSDEDVETNLFQSNNRSLKTTCCIGRSGSAADTQYLADRVRNDVIARSILRHDHSFLSSSVDVSQVAHLLRSYVSDNYSSRNSHGYSCSLVCAGYDAHTQQGCIYSIAPTGTLIPHKKFAVAGSGSTYVMGLLDESLGRSTTEVCEEECVHLVGRAMEAAKARDGSSGGYICLYVLDSSGKRPMVYCSGSGAALFGITGEAQRKDRIEKEEEKVSQKQIGPKGFAPPIRLT